MSRNVSVKKRIRQAEKAKQRNRHYKSLMKTAIKKVKEANTKAAAETLHREAVSIIDSVAGKGIIHFNSAAHKKAKLAAFISKLPQ